MGKDLRIDKTLEAIKKAHRELVMKTDSFTVKDIAEHARINRKTFYYHYDSLDDLRRQERYEAAEHALAAMHEPLGNADLPGCMKAAFMYLASDPEYNYRLLSREAYRRFSSEAYYELVSPQKLDALFPKAKDQKFALYFLINALVFSFCQWYDDGMTISAEEMAVHVTNTCFNGLQYR